MLVDHLFCGEYMVEKLNPRRRAMMEYEKKGLWKRVRESLQRFREGLEKDSVASNPRKPVDCCNPPVAEKTVPGNDHKVDV